MGQIMQKQIGQNGEKAKWAKFFFIHRVFLLSTDYHRLTQIYLISKDILIITDFLFGTEIHGFIFNKDTVWLRIDIIHGTS